MSDYGDPDDYYGSYGNESGDYYNSAAEHDQDYYYDPVDYSTGDHHYDDRGYAGHEPGDRYDAENGAGYGPDDFNTDEYVPPNAQHLAGYESPNDDYSPVDYDTGDHAPSGYSASSQYALADPVDDYDAPSDYNPMNYAPAGYGPSNYGPPKYADDYDSSDYGPPNYPPADDYDSSDNGPPNYPPADQSDYNEPADNSHSDAPSNSSPSEYDSSEYSHPSDYDSASYSSSNGNPDDQAAAEEGASWDHYPENYSLWDDEPSEAEPLLQEIDRDSNLFAEIENKVLSDIAAPRSSDPFNYSTFSVQKIEKINNVGLWSGHEEVRARYREECGDDNVMTLFHGTPHVDSIIEQGFDLNRAKDHRLFGPGIYLSEHSSVSNEYALGSGGCETHGDHGCHACPRRVLCCQVALGRTAELTYPDRNLRGPPEGYDSVRGPYLPRTPPHFAVYEEGQVYPMYVITYNLVQ